MKHLIYLLSCLFIFSCTKDEVKTKHDTYNTVNILYKSDTTNFNIENIDKSVFDKGSRNGVIPAPFLYLSSLSTDNFWVATNQNPRKHEMFSHHLVNIIYLNKVSSGTIVVSDNGTQVECANYNISIVYTDGTVDEFAWYMAPYLGESYTINPNRSLVHQSSNVKKSFVEQTRIDPGLFRMLYRPQNIIQMTKWNIYMDGVFVHQVYLFPEDFTSLIWRPKHKL